MHQQLDARVSEVARNIVRNNQTRLNYDGIEERYLEDEDDYDDPMTGDVEAASFGVPTDAVDNMTLSVDYTVDGPNALAGSIFDRPLRGAIRGPDSMYRKHDIFAEAWDEAPERDCVVSQLFLAVTYIKKNTPGHGREMQLGTTWMPIPTAKHKAQSTHCNSGTPSPMAWSYNCTQRLWF